jgi:hypothetical protein
MDGIVEEWGSLIICTSDHLAAELDPAPEQKVIIRRKMKSTRTKCCKQQSIPRTTTSLPKSHPVEYHSNTSLGNLQCKAPYLINEQRWVFKNPCIPNLNQN